jgi:nitric oxide reductase NorQ protein
MDSTLPWYRPVGHELEVVDHTFRNGLPLLIKGPTGCGKSRLVAHMAARFERPLVTVVCHDDTSSADLLGRWLVRGGDTVWQDGPVTRAVRQGAILYVDEIAEARPDVIVALHPLTDHRRELYLDRVDEVVRPAAGFQLVVSYNPGYQRGLKELRPSTRQRFVTLVLGWPPPEVEAEVLVRETGVDPASAKRLVALGVRLRQADALGLAEAPSTRLLVDAAALIRSGMHPWLACQVGVVDALTDDTDVAAAMSDMVHMVF